jgi:hypothetical protein
MTVDDTTIAKVATSANSTEANLERIALHPHSEP